MHTHTFVSYEEFGRRFFRKLRGHRGAGRAAFEQIAGNSFEMGPMSQGPGGLAKVSAKVEIQSPHVRRTLGETITFAIRIPLLIELTVDVWLDKPRFVVDGDIALRATARAAEPLMIVIDVAMQYARYRRARDVEILQGEIVRIIGGVDSESADFVANYVAEEIDSPASQQAKIIDVSEQVDAWES